MTDTLKTLLTQRINPELLKGDVIIFRKKNKDTLSDLLLREGEFHDLQGGSGMMMTDSTDFWKMMCFDTLGYRYTSYRDTCRCVVFVDANAIDQVIEFAEN